MEERKENRMGTMPVGKLLVTMSLPIMISMLIQALYNIVDSIFVAQIGENALTAVSLAFPVQNLIIAVGIGTGIGINSLRRKTASCSPSATGWSSPSSGGCFRRRFSAPSPRTPRSSRWAPTT